MIRISTIFVGICMVLISVSLGMVLYALAGLRPSDAAIVAVTALAFMILYNAVSIRLRDRTDVSGQIADLSQGTASLAHQVAEFGRRLAAAETRIAQSAHGSAQPQVEILQGEMSELGAIVRQLAISVAAHEDTLSSGPVTVHAPSISGQPVDDTPAAAERARAIAENIISANPAPVAAVAATSSAHIAAAIKSAIDDNRIDLYLQPLVTLPQRKVKYYEAVSRLRDANNQVLAANDFIGVAEQAGVMPQIDYMVMFRCVQVLRRLLVRSKDVGMFCNIAAATLHDDTSFQQCLDFLDANRALAPSLILEFKLSTFRSLGPVESEHLAALAQRGYRFSIDNVTDLRIDPRELADRGVRFIKVPATLLLDPPPAASSEIHAADLSDLLGRYGIDLIAERIESERAVVDLLDFDVRFGQGFLFASPRPLRPDTATAPVATPVAAAQVAPAPAPRNDPGVTRTGLAALARRNASSN